ncbi:MAG TPA: 3-oxoacyl-[acyl-carrier-protein] reductase [Firmicutes bacterium]|nr:3-oxoacyl-[acyl-carrier-protein] reductase [Candidatus Fermentithermobacillaceae bacterium]
MMVDRPCALVTGASRGIGRACALELSREGFKVAVNFNKDEAGALETVELILKEGGEARAYRADVSSHEEAKGLVTLTEEELGPVDVLVANAGITRDALLVRMTEEEWDGVVNTNLKGVYNVTKWAVRSMMKRRKGRVIAISSVVALTGNAGQANYCAAKAGIIGFVRALAREVARYGITANVVAPGFISTDMTKKLPEQARERLSGAIPLGRIGTPEDVAYAVRFLASDRAAYITGQVLPVDGGMSLGALT